LVVHTSFLHGNADFYKVRETPRHPIQIRILCKRNELVNFLVSKVFFDSASTMEAPRKKQLTEWKKRTNQSMKNEPLCPF